MKEKRFGEAAIEKGYVSAGQLAQALREQEEACGSGRANRFVGEILVERGFMTEKQVLDVLSTLHEHRPTV